MTNAQDDRRKSDIDALRAKLGIGKEAKAKAAPKKPEESFAVDFGEARKLEQSVSVLNSDMEKLGKPKARVVMVGVLVLIFVALGWYFGVQYGMDSGYKSLEAAGREQTKAVGLYLLEKQVDTAGKSYPSKLEGLQTFKSYFNLYYQRNILEAVSGLELEPMIVIMTRERLTEDPYRDMATRVAELGELADWKLQKEKLLHLEIEKGDLDGKATPSKAAVTIVTDQPIKLNLEGILEDYIASVGTMDVQGLFGDRIFHPILANEALVLAQATNQLRYEIEKLQGLLHKLSITSERVESYEVPGKANYNFVVWSKPEEGKVVSRGTIVKVGEDRRIRTNINKKVTCDPVELQVETDDCESKEDGAIRLVKVPSFQPGEIEEHVPYYEFDVKPVGVAKDEQPAATAVPDKELVRVNAEPVMTGLSKRVYRAYLDAMADRGLLLLEIMESLEKIGQLAVQISDDSLRDLIRNGTGNSDDY